VGALAWLVIPMLALCAAALWSKWASRNKGATGDGASLAGYERFRQAMQQPAGRGGAAPVEGPSDGDEDSPRGPLAGPVP
jgi:hypothetical protein